MHEEKKYANDRTLQNVAVDFSDQQAQHILDGYVLPDPKSLMKFPEHFDEMIGRITRLTIQEKMKLLPAVSECLDALENEIRNSRTQVQKTDWNLSAFRAQIAAAGAILQNVPLGFGIVRSFLTYMILYYYLMPIVSEKALEKLGKSKILLAKEMRQKIFTAFAPSDMPSIDPLGNL